MQGENPLPRADFEIREHVQPSTRFSLVCCPNYTRGGDNLIQIGTEDEDFRSRPRSTYDLDWTVETEELPNGHFLSGSRIRILLSCCRTNSRGRRSPSAYDKRWQLTLETDPFSKQLIISHDERKELPVWYMQC